MGYPVLLSLKRVPLILSGIHLCTGKQRVLQARAISGYVVATNLVIID